MINRFLKVNNKMLISSLFILLVLAGCVEKDARFITSHNPIIDVIPETNHNMNNAGYWISKLDTPDKVILSKEQITILNNRTLKKHHIIQNLTEYEDLTQDVIKTSIDTLFNAVNGKKRYKNDGSIVEEKELKLIYETIDIANVDDNISYGVITQRVSQKIIPSEYTLHTSDNQYFDRLQMSSLDIGTPIIILANTKDKDWYYVRSSLTVGWIPVEYFAFTTKDDIKTWENPKDFIISIKASSPIYKTNNFKPFITSAPLGVKLPISNTTDKHSRNYIEIILPTRDKSGNLEKIVAYMEMDDIHIGYLSYTQRNMLKLAFEVLHTPYGWGGMNGYQDCSGFLIQLFGSMGILLPRNSYDQGQTGLNIYNKNNTSKSAKDVFQNAMPGITTIQFPGHIMLYIGEDSGKFYTIHSVWGFEDIYNEERVLRIPARIIVSNLDLGSNSIKGPFIERITNINILK